MRWSRAALVLALLLTVPAGAERLSADNGFPRPFQLNGPWLTLARRTVPPRRVVTTSFEPSGKVLRRLDYFTRQRAYPGTELPRERIAEAMRRHRTEARTAAGAASWTSLGPATIEAPNADQLEWAGRVSGIVVHPTNPSTMYASSATGGIWKTVNAGASWTSLIDSQCSIDISSLVMDPVDPRILYAATGDQYTTAVSCGILRTLDGGTTWTTLPQPGGVFATRLMIDRASAGSATTTIVYAATWEGLYRSSNSGQSWTRVLLTPSWGITDVIADPVTSTTLYAGGTNLDGSGGIFKSTDNGLTWNVAENGLPSSYQKVLFAAAAAPSTTIVAAVAIDWYSARLYKTTDGGANWIELPAAQTVYPYNTFCPVQCTYDLAIGVSPLNENVIWAGAIDLFKSTDGGATFEYFTTDHADQHIFTFHPTQPATLFVGNDGGVYRIDNGQTTSTLNTNLAITQFYPGLGFHPTDPLHVVGGTQDNGGLAFTGSARFSWICCGDAGYGLVDPSDPSVAYLTNQANGGPERLENGDTIWIHEGLDLNESRRFISPMAMDPSTPTTLYYGLSRLYRTLNRGDLWQAVSPPIGNGWGITAIAVAPSDNTTIYVASANFIAVTTNATASWQTYDTGIGWISHVAVSPANPAVVYVTVSGSNTSGHVFKSVNYGASWQAISSGLPDISANSIALVPDGRLFVATDLGVFSSSNDGASWSWTSSGLPNVRVLDVVYNPGTHRLLAATFGRGLFEYPIGPVTITTLGVSANPSLSGQTITFTATVTSQTAGTITGTVTFKDGGVALGTGTIVNGVASLATSSLSVGAHTITAHYAGDAVFYPSASAPLQQLVNASPFGTPPFFSATATSASQATLTWGAVSGAAGYEIHRATSLNGGFTMVQATNGTSVVDSGLSPNTTYLYKVRAVANGGAKTAFSAVDPATLVTFTDSALSSGDRIKAAHVNELRTAVHAMRLAASLTPAAFTDTLAAGSTPVKRIHLAELRTTLDQARAAMGLPPIAYTDPTLVAASTYVHKAHILELRAGTQ